MFGAGTITLSHKAQKAQREILTQRRNGAKETLNLQPGFSLRRCAAA